MCGGGTTATARGRAGLLLLLELAAMLPWLAGSTAGAGGLAHWPMIRDENSSRLSRAPRLRSKQGANQMSGSTDPTVLDTMPAGPDRTGHHAGGTTATARGRAALLLLVLAVVLAGR
jgi:hypothetical protein